MSIYIFLLFFLASVLLVIGLTKKRRLFIVISIVLMLGVMVALVVLGQALKTM